MTSSTKKRLPCFRQRRIACLFLSVCLLLAGIVSCTKSPAPAKKPLQPNPASFKPYSNLLESSYSAADTLVEALHQRKISRDTQILSASFVNIDNLKESSTLGRVVAEQISSRLAQYGYKILEMKLRQESVFIKEKKGEFLLSRQLKNISTDQNADAVLVGTYAAADSSIFVSARIVNTTNNTVITGCDYRLALDFVTESLLETNTDTPTAVNFGS
ncbi:MAG TPA: FlgO family outer membrane protein [Desulfosalsimonadaceae bacterium]|nr:FlgO family outer membrane protein [Desulfosalsimonadaceae bacterium]